MTDTRQECKMCGCVNEGRYYKFHYGRYLRENDYIRERESANSTRVYLKPDLDPKRVYLDKSHGGNYSFTKEFYKQGEKEVFICDKCYNKERPSYDKLLLRRTVGSSIAI